MNRKSLSLIFLFMSVFFAFKPLQAQQQNTYYVYNGTTLEAMFDNPARVHSTHWQIWLYQVPMHIPHYTAGLPYSRWGLIEGRSAESVIEQLKASLSFEEVYLNFFGPGTWGRYTFVNPLGPVAIVDQAINKEPSAQLNQLIGLKYRLNSVIAAVQPSLENNESEGPSSPVKEYFDQIRDRVQQVSALYSQLARIRPQLRVINIEIFRTGAAVALAENNVPRITAVLPSVKLPASNTWMSYAEWAGSDGTIQTAITEAGSTALVQQTWTGGDGRMTGTDVLTIIPFADIGSVEFEPPLRNGGDRWTVRVASGARRSFPQTLTSPERKTARSIFRAINYTTIINSVYLVFPNSAEAQDAYAYFQYHKQLGR